MAATIKHHLYYDSHRVVIRLVTTGFVILTYLQSVLDCHSRFAWGRLYTTKLPVASVHVLNEDVRAGKCALHHEHS